jgi:hypothetical protein
MLVLECFAVFVVVAVFFALLIFHISGWLE